MARKRQRKKNKRKKKEKPSPKPDPPPNESAAGVARAAADAHLPATMAGLPPEEQEAVEGEAAGVLHQESLRVEKTTGSLPPPGMLQAYDEIVEDGAERIFSMAEAQSEHRRKCEWRLVKSRTRNETAGTWLGFISFLLFLGLAVWLILTGYEVPGVAMIALQLGATVFIRTHGHRAVVKAVRELREQ